MTSRERTDLIVVHCSATPPSMDIGANEIREWHTTPPRNWSDIGYHYVIRRNGRFEPGRPEWAVGAHARGVNGRSVGVCLIGGVHTEGGPDFNFTRKQMDTLAAFLVTLRLRYPEAEVVGHRDLSPDLDSDGVVEPHEWFKGCPSFDVRAWWAEEEVP